MLEAVHQFVSEGLTIDTLAALACIGGVASLHQKLFDVTVEDSAVVGPFGAKGEEVLAGGGSELAVEFEFDVAVSGM